MRLTWAATAAAAILMSLAPTGASADSISSVENARAKDRAGQRLNPQDRDQLRKYGGGSGDYASDDYGPRYRYRDGGYGGGYADGYGGGGVSVYIGPRYRYDPYGY